ncbi:hypothetical protein CROQUDRAFT_660484 [Cronartium quercuum f. sp. fusiforme G11]|uniref:Serine carboxypeptidase n=1 Tax=Cronartium quercuum f. sp. fusiforme G11 TaxID=708437 RepID=A0A9P6NI39_9BASI|nr:hypothetical protein CROQUDRAFT_660484 [Cronartium quercuum f. sp. fusiforme G11]
MASMGTFLILLSLSLRAVQPLTPLSPSPVFSLGRAHHRHQDHHERPLIFQTDLHNPSHNQLNNNYPAYNFTQLITHRPTSLVNNTFNQRFWFDASHYETGGPVILLDGGETTGEDRLPFLDHGILAIIAKATNGIGIILEHRYYGRSFPFQDLSVDSLQYLNTRESLDDSAYFAKNLCLPAFEHLNLTAPHTPWIYYGGSYAGAKAAFMMKLYPDLIWGSLASSAVVHAQVDFWQYYEPIRLHAPQHCIKPLIAITKAIDHVLMSGNRETVGMLKELFGLANVTDDRDFVNTLASPLGSWQEQNWDPEVGGHKFERFCEALRDRPKNSSFEEDVLPVSFLTALGGHAFSLNSFLGYVAYIRSTVATDCLPLKAQDECFGTSDSERHRAVGLDQSWRSWMWQVCTEWGFFQGAPPIEVEESLVSRLIDLDYSSRVCRFAFGSAIPRWPNVSMINQYGDFDLTATRLAYIDGSYDPWLYATPHSPTRKQIGKGKEHWLIKGGVHHWDENGAGDAEPSNIRMVHEAEVRWVKNWLEAFPYSS